MGSSSQYPYNAWYDGPNGYTITCNVGELKRVTPVTNKQTNKKQEAHGPWRSARVPTWPLTKLPGRYGPILQLAMFGHESLELAKRSKVAHVCIYTRSTQWVVIELIFHLWSAVSEIRADF